MNKLLFALLLISNCVHAQKDTTYLSIKDARKDPSNVYHLQLSGDKNVERRLKHLQSFENLESLDLSFCNLTKIPTDIFDCKQLKSLNLSSNSISSVPDELSNLTELRELNLSYNEVKSLPQTIGICQKLRILNLRGNYQLESIPVQFIQLDSLEELSCKVSEDDFIAIICQLSNLKKLEVYSSSNDLICHLSELKKLTSFMLVLLQTEFKPFQCSLHELSDLKTVCIVNLDCCWPYIDVSDELKNAMKKLLPEGCALRGFRRQATEIRSDIELR